MFSDKMVLQRASSHNCSAPVIPGSAEAAARVARVARTDVEEPGVCAHQIRVPAQRAANLQWDLDSTPLLTLRIADPAECEPRRTPRNSEWMPGKRDAHCCIRARALP